MGKHFIEGFPPALSFDLVVAIGLDQFLRRGWIVMGLECFIEVTELLARVVAHRFGFVGAVPCLLYLTLSLASLFVIGLLISAPFVVCHPLHYETDSDNDLVVHRCDHFEHTANANPSI